MITINNDQEREENKTHAAHASAELLDDLVTFTKVFYKLRTGREFVLGSPTGRESHYLIIARALQKVFDKRSFKTIINVPPRMGKTTLLMNFVAWSLAHYPDSNYLYVSYSHDLATLATAEIKQIITTPYYKKMFGVSLREDSQAKDSFQTTAGGSVVAVGSGGTLTGRAAGIFNCNRFGGVIVIDDIAKPSEASSQVIREGIKNWYYNTLQSRRNDAERTGICCIGQRVHEDDLMGHLIEQGDWDTVILPAIDKAGNSICPQLLNIRELRRLQEQQAYVFASQYQQNPVFAGSGLFKESYFPILDVQPDILMTFITVDCAASTKSWADFTVFSFFGVYEIKHFDKPTGLYGMHWLNCLQDRIEPKDLKHVFMEFYASCCAFGKTPAFAAIEKKSSGEYLVSTLSEIQGMSVIGIERTAKSGSKTDRFIQMQPYISQKLVTFPYGGRHNKMCIDHMVKITAEGSHAHDDISDTLFDCINAVCIDKTALAFISNIADKKEQAQKIIQEQLNLNSIRLDIWN